MAKHMGVVRVTNSNGTTFLRHQMVGRDEKVQAYLKAKNKELKDKSFREATEKLNTKKSIGEKYKEAKAELANAKRDLKDFNDKEAKERYKKAKERYLKAIKSKR